MKYVIDILKAIGAGWCILSTISVSALVVIDFDMMGEGATFVRWAVVCGSIVTTVGFIVFAVEQSQKKRK